MTQGEPIASQSNSNRLSFFLFFSLACYLREANAMTAANSAPPYFELSDATFGYVPGELVVHKVSLKINAGQMAGLIGPNGAGKSTLIQLMAGLLDPDSGEGRIQGDTARGLDPRLRARKVAFVPQSAKVFFPYTVEEIVWMGRHPHVQPLGGFSEKDGERVAWAMEATGIAPLRTRMFNQLSGGEAQRVILARALAQDAPALALDEPTSSLDLYYQALLYGLLEKQNREHGLTVVVVTHDVNLAAEYCPRLIGLREGRIILDGPPEEIVTTENIHRLYGVEAEILTSGGGRMARVRAKDEG